MADRVRKVSYCYAKVASRAGQGVKVLAELKNSGVNLVAFSGFPGKRGKSQLDFVAENLSGVRKVAHKNGWRLSKPKKAFLVTGNDVVGAVHRHLNKLAARKINITAADAVCAGKGRYGMLLWVKPKDFVRASRALNAK